MHQSEGIQDISGAGQWLDGNWLYAGVVAGLFYFACLPLLREKWTLPDLLLWLQLPLYIAHQLEEHVGDRFRRFVNLQIGQGQQVLTPRAVTVINVGGVWCVDFLALYLASFFWPGAALLAFYLAIVNAVVHLGGAIASRAYNPGLVTAAILLLPIGLWGARIYSSVYALPLRDHATAVVLIIVLHVAIILHVMQRRARFARAV